MRIEDDEKLDYDDVMLKCHRSFSASRKSIKLTRTFKFKYSIRELECLPVFCSNMATTGTFAMAKSLAKHKMLTCLHKHYTVRELIDFYDANQDIVPYVWYTLGINKQDLVKLSEFLKGTTLNRPNICIDVANGHTDDFVKTCKTVRNMVGYTPAIMAGNIGTPDMVTELILHGEVDIVKCGIGSGAECETRRVTGCGYPQFSLTGECSNLAHGTEKGRMCSDGGIKHVGDIAKAFGAGADFVMCGRLFAGAEECDGEWQLEYRNSYGNWQPVPAFADSLVRKVRLKHFGMSSEHAHNLFDGGLKDYKAAEGSVRWVDYKGTADIIVQKIAGGLRSACTHIGASCVKDMEKCATFMKVRRWK